MPRRSVTAFPLHVVRGVFAPSLAIVTVLGLAIAAAATPLDPADTAASIQWYSAEAVTAMLVALAASLLALFSLRQNIRLRRLHEDRLRTEGMLDLTRRALDSAANGIVIADASGSDLPIIYVNTAFERITGYTYAETIGRNARFLQGDRNQSGLAELRSALKDRRPCRVILRNRRKDGSFYWNELTISPVKDAGGSVTHFIGVQNDISVRKAAEAALLEAEKLRRSLIDSISEGVLLHDETGHILLSNPAAQRMLGFSADQLRGRSAGDDGWKTVRLDGSPLPAEERPVVRAMATGEPQRNVVVGIHDSTDRLLWISVNAEPIFRPDEAKSTGVVSSFSDVTSRVYAENRMRQQAQIINQVNDGIITTGLDGIISSWNAGAEKIFRLERSAAIGRPLSFFCPPHESIDLSALDADRAPELKTDTELVRPDGSRLHAHVSFTVLKNEQERPMGYIGVIVDITDRKEAEDALRRSQKRHAMLLANLPGFAYRCLNDAERTMIFASAGSVELTGFSPEEFTSGRVKYTSIIHDYDREKIWKTVQDGMDRHEPYLMSYRIVTRDGSVKWVWERGHCVLAADGTLEAREGIIIDITSQKRAEEERENLLRDLGMRMRQLNCLYGLSRFAVQPFSSMRDILHDLASLIPTAWESSRRVGVRIRYQDDIYQSQGFHEGPLVEVVPIEISNRSVGTLEVHAGAGEFTVEETALIHALAEQIGQIAEKRELEDELRGALAGAERASQAKSNFLAGMSHELRTPLNSIIGFSNIILKKHDAALSQSAKTFLSRILSNGEHLLDLINQILDLAKIESGKMTLELADVDLAELIREVVALMKGQIGERALTIEASLPNAPAITHTDRVRLKQVLYNLIGNALKFTERGHISVRLHTAGGAPTLIEVEDTGIGIPQEKLGTIFEAFEQAESGIARRFGGTGLGLSISRSICRSLGYRIAVESVVEQGTVFTIDLRHREQEP